MGKVLSPTTLHVNTVQAAMKPAWGNPFGLNICSIGVKEDNLFVAEFGGKDDMDQALSGSKWMVGKHAILLQPYDERLSPVVEIVFERIEIWALIHSLPFRWMNKQKGERAIGVLGKVEKMDVDSEEKASGAYLRAHTTIELNKPIKRGVLLKMKKTEEHYWIDTQYDKFPFVCLSCVFTGHSEVECGLPATRNAHGKLPYDLPLQALDEDSSSSART